MLEGDVETAHGFAPKKPKPDSDGGPSEDEAVTKIILNCPNETFQADLIDAVEKKQRRRRAAASSDSDRDSTGVP